MAQDTIVASAQKAATHKVTKNTGYQIFGKIFTALAGLITTRLVATHYGQNGVGEFTLIFNFINVFYLLSDFGLNAIVVKQMVEKPTEETKLYNSLLGLRVAASIGLTTFALILLSFMPYNPATQTGYSPIFKQGAALLLLTLITQGSYLSALALIQRKLLYNIANFAVAIGSVVTVATFYLFITLRLPFNVALAAFVLGSATTAIITMGGLPLKTNAKFLASFSLRFWKTFVIPALPLAAMLILNVAYFRSDSFILAKLKPVSDVGIYGVAYKLFEQALVIPVFFINALYPTLLEQATYAKNRLYATLKLTSTILLMGGIAAAIALYLAAPVLIAIITNGNAFAASVSPLRILALGLPFFFLSNLFLWLLVTLGKQKYLLAIYGSTMLLNIAGNILFIPRYSFIASAWLTTICEGIVLALTMALGLYFLSKHTPIKDHAAKVADPDIE